ncbi:hypothetical protein DMUE_1417 [Dictyocoela muelleri]|nr:hypothetical protein DMUE_1417 [Dictyocoela muelleri]
MLYLDFTLKSISDIWKYFLRSEDGQTAKCKRLKCQKILRINGGSTKGLHTHLYAVHKIKACIQVLPENKNWSDLDVPNEKLKSIKDFLIKNSDDASMEDCFARLVAVDGITFNVISFSPDLHAGLNAMGYKNIQSLLNSARVCFKI